MHDSKVLNKVQLVGAVKVQNLNETSIQNQYEKLKKV